MSNLKIETASGTRNLIATVVRFVLQASGLAILLLTWRAVIRARMSPPLLIAFATGGLLLLVVVAILARRSLDQYPTLRHAKQIALLTHYGIMLPLGCAIIAVMRLAVSRPLWTMPLPCAMTTPSLWVCSILAALCVLTLAIGAHGAPFAIVLSRHLATDWLYSRTRNPMVLATILLLIATALWLRSFSLLIWAIVAFTPALIAMVKIYEERELEIRFGQKYLDYKSRTPLLLPFRVP